MGLPLEWKRKAYISGLGDCLLGQPGLYRTLQISLVNREREWR